MKLVIGMIFLAMGFAALWIAFHDIHTLVGENPTPSKIIGLINPTQQGGQ